MKAENVYIKAAELVQESSGEGRASCLAIDDVQGIIFRGFTPAATKYSELLQPDSACSWEVWGRRWSTQSPCTSGWNREIKACRILALCLMAAMDEAGDAYL